MIRSLARRHPLFKIVTIVQLALLAHRHLGRLTPHERRRARELVLRPFHLNRTERRELRDIAMKLEPRAFAGTAADRLSPFPLPRWLTHAKR